MASGGSWPKSGRRSRRHPGGSALAKRVILAVVLLSPAFAGCIDPTAASITEGASEAAAVGLAFDTPVALPHDRHGAEPNVAVAADGTLFVTAQTGSVAKPGAVESTAWLWRSRDDGATWEVLMSPHPQHAEESPAPLPRAFCSCDADVVTSPDGWVYHTDWWVNGAVGGFRVDRSSDGGDTWTGNAAVSLPHATVVVDRQWLLAGDDGFVALFYHQWDVAEHTVEGTGARIMAVYSHDHGATWSLPSVVVGDTGAVYHAQAHPQVLPGGTLLMVFMDVLADDDEPCNIFLQCPRILELPATVRVALSEDDGATWDIVDVAHAPEGVGAALPIGAAVDATGRVLVAYSANTGDNIAVFVSESLDNGRMWSEPETLAAEGLNVLPWAAGTGDGRFAVGWYHAPWSGPANEAPKDTPWHVLAADRAGPGATWAVETVDPAPVTTGPYCFGGSTCTRPRPLADYLSLAYGPDGALHVAYVREAQTPPLHAGPIEVLPPAVVGHTHYARTFAGGGGLR